MRLFIKYILAILIIAEIEAIPVSMIIEMYSSYNISLLKFLFSDVVAFTFTLIFIWIFGFNKED